jgi:hypothetical protein
LQKLRQGIKENGKSLKRLAAAAQDTEGSYDTLVAACRAIADAEYKIRG